ncbi:hypothetical protein ACIPWI_35175 [Streptomyces sp. NPDC090046]|uniref:hypothetical protein n=1 Tax=Streptomyces sp. NPDC090046 TaxID=3365928 RepID=UPI0037F9FDC8
MKMNEIYQKAIDEELQSVTTGQSLPDLTLNNELNFPLAVYLISDYGWWIGGMDQAFVEPPGYPGLVVPANRTMDVYCPGEFDLGWYLIFLNAHSGAFVAVIQVASAFYSQNNGCYWMTLDQTCLLDPNSIGSVPEPYETVIIPPDSPRVVVASGYLPLTGNTVVREQYWQRLPDSYSIAAGAKRTISYTTTSGMESTTSEQTQIGTSVTGSTTAGWGPISATLSASLSNNSTTFQQTSTNVETTAFVSQTYDNTKGEKSRICFYWQLTNLLTVFDPAGNPLTSLVYGAESPAVIDAHNIDDLPPRPVKKELPMSADMQARLSLSSPTLAAGEAR